MRESGRQRQGLMVREHHSIHDGKNGKKKWKNRKCGHLKNGGFFEWSVGANGVVDAQVMAGIDGA